MKEPEEKDFSKVFIIHGHDKELREETVRLLRQQGIGAVILSEQVSRGRTIIEQLEEYTNVSAAVCLFTSDDLGKEKTDTDVNIRCRARQNVVFETGLLMGRIGRENLVIIAENDIEMPSDLKGVIYIEKKDLRTPLLKELKDMGFSVDMSRPALK